MQHVKDEYFFQVNHADQEIKNRIVLYKHNKELTRLLADDKWKIRQTQILKNAFERYRRRYNVLEKMIRARAEGKRLEDYLGQRQYYRIAIYGFAEIGLLLYEELKYTIIDVEYLIDRDAGNIKVDIPVITPEEEFLPVDVIVVTAVYAFRDIRKYLKQKTEIPIISIEKLFET